MTEMICPLCCYIRIVHDFSCNNKDNHFPFRTVNVLNFVHFVEGAIIDPDWVDRPVGEVKTKQEVIARRRRAIRITERISAWAGRHPRRSVDEEEVPHRRVGPICPAGARTEKIERSAEASRDDHVPLSSPSRILGPFPISVSESIPQNHRVTGGTNGKCSGAKLTPNSVYFRRESCVES